MNTISHVSTNICQLSKQCSFASLETINVFSHFVFQFYYTKMENLTIFDQEEDSLMMMNMSCPEFTEFSSEMLTQVSFWVEGALSCSVAMAGFLGNVGSVVILSGKEMRNSFNWLLIGLACFDNVYLLGSILESFRKDFEMVILKRLLESIPSK